MTGLVVCFGLLTVDHLLVVDRLPRSNEKMVASNSEVDFGGPAANAAAAAAVLGSSSRLVTAVGDGALATFAGVRLRSLGVDVRDLLAGEPGDPPISTILVTESTGERAVVSVNAAGVRADLDPAGDELDGADVLLLDGHHMSTAIRLARVAHDRGILVILDGGSWKAGTEELLKYAHIAVVSDDFRVPEIGDVLDYLSAAGCRAVASTAGGNPILGAVDGERFEIAVPLVDHVVDTLGAGDTIHGALAHYLAENPTTSDFVSALHRAARIASESCRFAGAHGWFDERRLRKA